MCSTPMGLHLKNNANQPLFPFLYRNGNQQYIHRVFMCISKKLHGGAAAQYTFYDSKLLTTLIVLVHLIPSWLVIHCTVYVALSK